jgi:hypothetical protein
MERLDRWWSTRETAQPEIRLASSGFGASHGSRQQHAASGGRPGSFRLDVWHPGRFSRPVSPALRGSISLLDGYFCRAGGTVPPGAQCSGRRRQARRRASLLYPSGPIDLDARVPASSRTSASGDWAVRHHRCEPRRAGLAVRPDRLATATSGSTNLRQSRMFALGPASARTVLPAITGDVRWARSPTTSRLGRIGWFAATADGGRGTTSPRRPGWARRSSHPPLAGGTRQW